MYLGITKQQMLGFGHLNNEGNNYINVSGGKSRLIECSGKNQGGEENEYGKLCLESNKLRSISEVFEHQIPSNLDHTRWGQRGTGVLIDGLNP